MTKVRSQSPSGEIDETQSAINKETNAAKRCVQIIREFLVLADAPAGADEALTCRTAIFENVKGYGFQQQVAEPLAEAAGDFSSEPIREVLLRCAVESDRPLIASIDAWSISWHDLAFHVLSDLAESANHILQREIFIDYRDASEDDLNYFKRTMYGWRVTQDWFDVLFFVKHQWRFRSIKLDQIENGIHRENLRTYGDKVGNKPSREQQPTNANGSRLKTGLLPDGWHTTPLCGTLKKLAEWENTSTVTLNAHALKGVRWRIVPWGGKDDGTGWQTPFAIYYPGIEKFGTANKRYLADVKSRLAEIETKKQQEIASNQKKSKADRPKAKRK